MRAKPLLQRHAVPDNVDHAVHHGLRASLIFARLDGGAQLRDGFQQLPQPCEELDAGLDSKPNSG